MNTPIYCYTFTTENMKNINTNIFREKEHDSLSTCGFFSYIYSNTYRSIKIQTLSWKEYCDIVKSTMYNTTPKITILVI